MRGEATTTERIIDWLFRSIIHIVSTQVGLSLAFWVIAGVICEELLVI